VPGPPLVTGATGFAGRHLLEHLLEHESAVAGWANPSGTPPPASTGRVRWQAVDLLDGQAVERALAELRPSAIYHCAGDADMARSWSDPARALRVNVLGTHHLFEGLRRAGLRCPVLVTGSAAVYRASSMAMTEDAPIGPSSPYGLSKLAQEMIGRGAVAFPVLLARPFNHAGPRQSAAYVTSSFARQIAAIEAGLAEPRLLVGNLDARRDLTDVRDVVRAYRLLMDAGEPGRPYNVCSGEAFRIRDLLDMLLSLSRAPVRVEQDPARQRPSDTPIVLGDHGALTRAVGWAPAIAIRRTLHDLLEFWRGQTGRAS
jgi:GDP-4-dehydro-6-deoxy-D-mannose reductase